MINSSKKPTLKRWIFFTSLGWLIGILLVVGLAILTEVVFKSPNGKGGQAAVGIGMGAGIGFMQWMALRTYLETSQRFFWFNVIGFSIAFILRDIADIMTNNFMLNTKVTVEMTIPFAVLLGAIISSWLQHNFIFKKIMDGSFSWIYYSVIGWLLATMVTMNMTIFDIKLGEHFSKILIGIIALLFLSVGGPILGFITGRFLIKKLYQLDEKVNMPLSTH